MIILLLINFCLRNYLRCKSHVKWLFFFINLTILPVFSHYLLGRWQRCVTLGNLLRIISCLVNLRKIIAFRVRKINWAFFASIQTNANIWSWFWSKIFHFLKVLFRGIFYWVRLIKFRHHQNFRSGLIR